MTAVAVLLILETDDRRLQPDKLDVSTAAKAAAVRQAVISNLPNLSRVVFVTSEEQANLMCLAHDVVRREMFDEEAAKPPRDYIPPTRD